MSTSAQPFDVLKWFNLEGRAAVITGAGRGLGRAMALALAGAGAHVSIWDVNQEDVESAAADITASGGTALPLVVDVTNSQQVEKAIEQVVREFGGLHAIVNNAGVTSGSPFEELSEEDWARVLGVNLTGMFLCAKYAGRQMIKQGRGGSVINVASISGLVGNRGGNNTHYCTTKGGAIALTRSLAVEWAPHRIRVNAIAPGYFVTPMTDRLKNRDAEFYQELIDRVPLGRFGQPEDLAGAVVFLAGDASTFVSGHILVVDGGYTAW